MNLQSWLQQQQPSIPLKSAEAVLTLTAEGATLPFIARYRKEMTGGLDEVQIQKVLDEKESFDLITHRQTFILGEIEKQGKLTDELKAKISSTWQMNLLEDLYLPYKVKKKSKATLAKEAGLQDLADWIWDCGHGSRKPEPGQTLELWAHTFLNAEKGFDSAEKAIQGAQDILVERLSENGSLRQQVRDAVMKEGCMKTSKAAKAKPNSKYEMYFAYQEPIQNLMKAENSHRYLAIRRGWMEEELSIGFGGQTAPGASAAEEEAFNAGLQSRFEAEACADRESVGAEILLKAARIAFKAHVLPAIENEAHKAMKEVADETAIRVFSENVKKLLLASPFGPKAVLGVDPGLRTGCKLAVINDSGKFIADTVVHLQTDDQKEKAKALIQSVTSVGEIRAIAVGNGTAGRETEAFFRQTLKELGLDIPVVMVNESGASVYSASEAAREEFPSLDVTVRGAISIARRLQDPLAELVKIDPKSIGVGQYQHDVSPGSLKKSLELVVDTCVNSVGVNLNTASYHLLSRVSGIGQALARAIVEHRGAKGIFKTRQDLLEVPRFSQKAFEQAAGFLRVPESENPLDNTGVHPERYGVLEETAAKVGKTVRDLMGTDGIRALKASKETLVEMRAKVGEFTFDDIVRELEKPGRDPRAQFIPFSYRDDIFTVKDLKPAMLCPGIVTNVTNFGAFVDIGVHQDGLVHISQLADRFVKDPREVVSPGERVQVKVLEVNLEKNQIALTMRVQERPVAAPAEAKAESGRREERGGRGGERGPRASERSGHGGHGGGEHSGRAGGGHGGRAGSERGGHAGAKSFGDKRPTISKPGSGAPRIGDASTRSAPAPKGPQFTNNAFAGLAALKNQLKK